MKEKRFKKVNITTKEEKIVKKKKTDIPSDKNKVERRFRDTTTSCFRHRATINK